MVENIVNFFGIIITEERSDEYEEQINNNDKKGKVVNDKKTKEGCTINNENIVNSV